MAWWRRPGGSTKSIVSAVPRWPVNDLARTIWPSATSPSIDAARSSSSRFRLMAQPVMSWSASSKLCRRVSHPVDDGLSFARTLVEPARLRVVIDHHRPVVDAHQPGAVEGVSADDAFAGFLRPHLVEDEIAVGIGDQLAVVDLDRKSTRLNSSHVSISYAVFCL